MPTDALTSPSLANEIRSRHQSEVSSRRRFEFGSNWRSYLASIDDDRIEQATESLQRMLDRDNLDGASFVDVGCGSGLFSLAAIRLGASRVHSFDFDPECVACAEVLRERYDASPECWSVDVGDALSRPYQEALGKFDVVYSWGVLHQTGDMWTALDNVARLTADDGQLFLSIYNHQPWLTPFWTTVKRIYNLSPPLVRRLMVATHWGAKTPLLWTRNALRPKADPRAVGTRSLRGMNAYHDSVDWIGGYPFETAAPEAVFRFFAARGFELTNLTTVGGGSGCNEFVFRKRS